MPHVRLFQEANKIIQDLYPELVHKVIVINPPMFFGPAFTLVRPFLAQRTIDRIVVCRDKDPYPTLSQYIDDEFIPACYGGKGPDPDPTGEVILLI